MIDRQQEQQLIDVVRARVKKQLDVPDTVSLDLDENLTFIGLNSMSSIALILDLEDEFGISFPDTGLLLSNFSTIRLIVEQIKAAD